MTKEFLNTRFGIEIEFTGITRKAAANVVAEVLEVSMRNVRFAGGCYDKYVVTDSRYREWNIVSDSSLDAQRKNRSGAIVNATSDYRCELVSPILTYEEDMETLQNIIRAFRKNGGLTNSSCGIHIHLDGAGHDVKSIKNFINLFASHGDLLYKALQVKAYRQNFCKKLEGKFVQRVKEAKPRTLKQVEDIGYEGYSNYRDTHYHNSRYHMLNLHSFFHGGNKTTVELRCFNSELHAGKVRAYVALALALNYQALTAKSVRAEASQQSIDNPKFAMRTWLNRIGFIGEEFKNCREHLIKHLDGCAAWRFGRAA